MSTLEGWITKRLLKDKKTIENLSLVRLEACYLVTFPLYFHGNSFMILHIPLVHPNNSTLNDGYPTNSLTLILMKRATMGGLRLWPTAEV